MLYEKYPGLNHALQEASLDTAGVVCINATETKVVMLGSFTAQQLNKQCSGATHRRHSTNQGVATVLTIPLSLDTVIKKVKEL